MPAAPRSFFTPSRTAQTLGARGAQTLAVVLASGLGLGFAPIAPGTVGTLLAVPMYWGGHFLSRPWQLAALLLIFAIAVVTAEVAGRVFGEADSGHIVIDEVAGYLTAVVLIPYSWQSAVVAFFFFRLFDIVKPWPARYFDRQVKNGWGVVLDDVAAGIYAGLCTFGALKLWGG